MADISKYQERRLSKPRTTLSLSSSARKLELLCDRITGGKARFFAPMGRKER